MAVLERVSVRPLGSGPFGDGQLRPPPRRSHLHHRLPHCLLLHHLPDRSDRIAASRVRHTLAPCIARSHAPFRRFRNDSPPLRHAPSSHHAARPSHLLCHHTAYRSGVCCPPRAQAVPKPQQSRLHPQRRRVPRRVTAMADLQCRVSRRTPSRGQCTSHGQAASRASSTTSGYATTAAVRSATTQPPSSVC